jgi:hypothetical protein
MFHSDWSRRRHDCWKNEIQVDHINVKSKTESQTNMVN